MPKVSNVEFSVVSSALQDKGKFGTAFNDIIHNNIEKQRAND